MSTSIFVYHCRSENVISKEIPDKGIFGLDFVGEYPEEISLPPLSEGNCNQPARFWKPYWLNAYTEKLGLSEDFATFDLWKVDPKFSDGYFFKFDWRKAHEVVLRYQTLADDVKELFVEDEYGNNYDAVKYYLNCAQITIEHVLAQSDPENYYISIG